MRQKIASFKEGNSVCSGTKMFQGPTLAGVVDEYMKFSGGDLVENRDAKS